MTELEIKKPKKVLLHCCCAPCATASTERLESEGYQVTLFWYNPNIYDKHEYEKRLFAFKKFAAHEKYPVIISSDYKVEHKKWLDHIKGLENEKEGGKRCNKCFECRLLKTAEVTKEESFDLYTTTLSISPHKDFEKILKSAESASSKNLAKFLEIDFKKKGGFQRSTELSKNLSLYRQAWCGCEFSKSNSQ